MILVLKGVSLKVPEDSIVALLGANGAGKTTPLRAISNRLCGKRGEITKGHIQLRDERIEHLPPSDFVKRGVVQVMEGRHCFAHLTVEENLLTGAYTRRLGRADTAAPLAGAGLYLFSTSEAAPWQPVRVHLHLGGQQMMAIGRALMDDPRIILLDDPSMGLAPRIVKEIFEIVRNLNQREGVSFLLAEQNTHVALRYADYGYILENGRVMMDGTTQALARNEDVKEFYLGISSGERRSFRDTKFYRRRKRWLA